MMWPGLRSRWTTPREWAWSRASATWPAQLHARTTGSGTRPASSKARVVPSTTSMTMNSWPSTSPESRTRTIERWSRLLPSSASRRNRLTKVESDSEVVSGTFNATSVSSPARRAR